MAYSFTNKEVAQLFRNVAAIYQIKNFNQFQIRAYDLAADAIEQEGSDIKSLWEEEALDTIPGLGEKLRGYLDELFKTGKVTYFDELFKEFPSSIFIFLKIPRVGPKTAEKLSKAGISDITALEKKINSGELLEKGFSEKASKNLLDGINEFKKKSDRILLPFAMEAAKEILDYLKQNPQVKEAHTLGSLRRRVATIGDIDISVASEAAEEVIKYFSLFPKVTRVVEAGEKISTVILRNGYTVDLMVQPVENYGNLLQHFTGSKSHNIKFRSLAREKGFSVSEYGIKETETGKNFKFKKEEEVYNFLGMEFPVPELREDKGELELALKNKLPKLIELKDIKGDLHTHSLYSDGRSSIKEMSDEAARLGREYIALTDHSYPHLLDFEARLKDIEQYNYSQDNIRVINGLEVNINADATLQVPNEVLKKHEFILVSIHTSFRQSQEEMTKRILKALENPYVNALSHPTGRMLLEREGIEADWEKIFQFAKENGKIIEINAFPNRTDLPDLLIREARKFGVLFSIDTDSHHISHLNLMEYGVDNARRGWVGKNEVINTLPYAELMTIIGKNKRR